VHYLLKLVKLFVYCLLSLLLISCTGTHVETTWFPPKFSATIPLSDLLNNISDTISPKKNITSIAEITKEDITSSSIEKYKIVFYDTGYVKQLTIHTSGTDHPLELKDGRIFNFYLFYTGGKYTLAPGTEITLYQPNGALKSIYIPQNNELIRF
jgi:hypothetical protein